MERVLSHSHISTFCKNVIPLRLLGKEPFETEEIVWSCDTDGIRITALSEGGIDGLTNGVLLTVLRPCEGVVTASVDGKTYSCRVEAREMRQFPGGKGLGYFIGDFHDHTHKSHKKAEFTARETSLPGDYIRQVKNEGLIDFGVISDHGSVLNNREFFRGFTDEEDCQPMDLVIFPGCESEVSAVEKDRYGVPHKNSGEIVSVNAAGFSNCHDWADFFRDLENSPFAICTLAHPQISGFSVPGIWNFSLHKNRSPRFREMVKMIEMGDGSDRQSNLINEYVYSVALDNGFRVSATCSSDSHGPVWGFSRFPGKTVIMASEKSKEAFLDAIWHNRIYACESGNVKLYYEVNGFSAPCEIPLTETYRFHVELAYFQNRPDTRPVKCQVVSNDGKYVTTVSCKGLDAFDFSLDSEDAKYFFLRLVDEKGRKTWSCPIWTGRTCEPLPEEDWIPWEKNSFTVTEKLGGSDASAVLDDDPDTFFLSEKSQCDLWIDMKEEKEISALGHYPRIIYQKEIREKGLIPADQICQYPHEYRISTGNDPELLVPVAQGKFRIFGGEEMIRFASHKARFVRVEIVSSVGISCELEKYADAKIAIGEITLFHK